MFLPPSGTLVAVPDHSSWHNKVQSASEVSPIKLTHPINLVKDEEGPCIKDSVVKEKQLYSVHSIRNVETKILTSASQDIWQAIQDTAYIETS